MKKYRGLAIFGILVAIVLLLFTALPAVAAFVDAFFMRGTINEPFEVRGLNVPMNVFPGNNVVFDGTVMNRSTDTAYGVRYYSNAYYFYEAGPGLGQLPETTVKDIVRGAEIKREKKEVKIPIVPAVRAGGGKETPSEVGWIKLEVDPDGEGPKGFEVYQPNSIVNIAPNGTHKIRATLRVDHSAYAGQIGGYVQPERVIPTVEAKLEAK